MDPAEDLIPPFPDMATTGRMVALFLLYFIMARIGLSLDATHTYISLVWPPSGIALAAFILYGSQIAIPVFAAAFLVNASLGAPLLVAALIATGNTAAPWVGSRLLRSYRAYQTAHPLFPTLRDNLGVLIAALFIPTISATIGMFGLWSGSLLPASDIGSAWVLWWVGDMLGIIVLTPFILKWFSLPITYSRQEALELVLMLVAVGLTAYVVFWLQSDFAYYLFIPLMWVALRTGERGATLSVVVASAIALAGSIFGNGPFDLHDLLHLQIFLAVTAGVLIVFSSAVDERRRVRVQLEKHAAELEDALSAIRAEDEAKKEFISILAHELRNPLATILSSVELINLQGISEETTPELLTTINERSRAMVRLLDDLLDISRISEKKLRLNRRDVLVKPFFKKLGTIVYPLMKRYGHAISMTAGDETLSLRADPSRLEQILLNLLAYAARYSKAKGSIEVIGRREQEFYAFHIRDKGGGIPRSMLRRIFEPFFQVSREAVGDEGIGVSLALTRELVEMHGGTIEAKNATRDHGSEFIVRIPLAEVPVQTEIIPSTSAVQRAAEPYLNAEAQLKRTFRILVVDDNEAASDALSQLLALRGHTTAVAFSGAEALTKAETFEPDVIFLDIGLPDMLGYDVARKLREHAWPYFIVALTGYGQEDDRERAREAGIDQHLTKPAGFKEIQAVLRKYPRTRPRR